MPSNVNNQNLLLDTQFRQFVQFARGGGEGGRFDGGAADGVPNGDLSGFMRV